MAEAGWQKPVGRSHPPIVGTRGAAPHKEQCQRKRILYCIVRTKNQQVEY